MSNSNNRRIVVTGIGLVTPLADGVKNTWQKLINGECAIDHITQFDVSDLPVKIAAMLISADKKDGFDLTKYIPELREHKKIDNFISYGIASSMQAVEDAGINCLSEEEKRDVGVIIGSGIGGLPYIEHNVNTLFGSGYRRVSPFFIPGSLINLTAGHVAMKYNFQGINDATVAACATGVSSIAYAARVIKCAEADVMVAGSSEASICKTGIIGFGAMKALSVKNDKPKESSRPWDMDRDGFVMGEGSGTLILEEYEHAKKRGAKMYAELLGYGATGDAHHIAAPRPDGVIAARSMELALKMSNKNPTDIGYINAHATSTPVGDITELKSILRIFTEKDKVAVSSTKGAIGHLLGAAGSVEAIFAILAMNNSVIPPTINLNNPDEFCLGMNLVPNIAQEKKLDCVLSNSFGFGGTNHSIVFGKI